jgi:hypothetical protein
MAREPQRDERPHQLDAKIVPVERALLARAEFLSLRASQRNAVNDAFAIRNGLDAENRPDIESALDARMADEFRALAAELHHW